MSNSDSMEYLEQVFVIISNVLEEYRPDKAYVIQIENWFGKNWVGFSESGTHAKTGRTAEIPPFHPNRVLRSDLFEYEPKESSFRLDMNSSSAEYIKLSQKSSMKNLRKWFKDTAFFWYCSNSKLNGQGALMVYVPIKGEHWLWYSNLVQPNWNSNQFVGISSDKFLKLAFKKTAHFIPDDFNESVILN